MNKKIAMYTPPFPRLKSYIDLIDLACEYGVSAVEPFSVLDFATPDVEKAKRIKEYADEKGIVFPCVSIYANVLDGNTEGQLEMLKGYADVAAILGSPYIHHTIAGEFEDPSKVIDSRGELMDEGVRFVREVYDYAEQKGVRAIYEDQGFIFNGVEGFGEFLCKVNRNVGVVADFGNIFQSGDCIEDFVKAFHDRFVHAHIKDVTVSDDRNSTAFPALGGKFVDYVAIGHGQIDIKGVIGLLRSYGYDGYYGIEYSVTDDNSPVIKEIFDNVDGWLNC